MFHERLWPALAALQGLLSAAAITYFVLSFRNRLGRAAQLAAVLLCGLHPYFAAFNAAALTESVSASILLVSIGIAIRALDGRLLLRASVTCLLLLSFVATQFRPYLGAVGVVAVALIVFQQRPRRQFALYLVTAAVFAAGVMAFPVYRAALGAGFFLPNVSALMLTHVSHVSWDLDQETAEILKPVVLNDGIRERLIGRGAFDYGDAKRVFDDLVSSGVPPAEARRRIAAAAWRVRTLWFWSIERQLQLPLASIGLQIAPACCTLGRELTRDLTGGGMIRHLRWYWRWNSGLDKNSYLEYSIVSQR